MMLAFLELLQGGTWPIWDQRFFLGCVCDYTVYFEFPVLTDFVQVQHSAVCHSLRSAFLVSPSAVVGTKIWEEGEEDEIPIKSLTNEGIGCL